MKEWDKIFKKKGKVFLKPQEDIPRIVKLFKNNGVKNILDLGCGSGRHTVCLAKQNFDVYGFDIAEKGIKLAKAWLKKEHLKVYFKVGDIYKKLPYDDNSFDAIISVQVLQHGTLNQIKLAIEEIKRILRPKDLLFVTLSGRYSKGKVRYCLVKTAKKIAPRTYLPTIGDEAGLIHYIYDKKTLIKHYKDFKVIDLWRDKKDYYCFLVKNKKL